LIDCKTAKTYPFQWLYKKIDIKTGRIPVILPVKLMKINGFEKKS